MLISPSPADGDPSGFEREGNIPTSLRDVQSFANAMDPTRTGRHPASTSPGKSDSRQPDRLSLRMTGSYHADGAPAEPFG
jgi:hypothetical protein